MTNVLIGCEYSGRVRDAFTKKGHFAISCDLLHSESPGPHYQDYIENVLGEKKWDLIILHPPCTAMSLSGNRWYGKGMPMHFKRIEAVKWTQWLWDHACDICGRVGMENPAGVLNTMGNFPKPQYIQPWQFGHGETKKTGLWLHGLPPLQPTDEVEGRENRIHKMPPSSDRGKLRSLTYQGIADAMAD